MSSHAFEQVIEGTLKNGSMTRDTPASTAFDSNRMSRGDGHQGFLNSLGSNQLKKNGILGSNASEQGNPYLSSERLSRENHGRFGLRKNTHHTTHLTGKMQVSSPIQDNLS